MTVFNFGLFVKEWKFETPDMFISNAGDGYWNDCILFGNPVGMIWELENVGKRNILIACELRNTGTRTISITCELRNTGTRTSLIACGAWRADGRTGGRVGWLEHLRKNPFWEYVSWKNWILYISLNPDFSIFSQKRCTPKKYEIWRRFRAEISHMGSIQAWKLKLLKWHYDNLGTWFQYQFPKQLILKL